MVGMILVMLLCLVGGTIFNYYGISVIEEAMSLTNGAEAIIQFLFGMIAWLVSCAFFVSTTIIGKRIVDDLKGE